MEERRQVENGVKPFFNGSTDIDRFFPIFGLPREERKRIESRRDTIEYLSERCLINSLDLVLDFHFRLYKEAPDLQKYDVSIKPLTHDQLAQVLDEGHVAWWLRFQAMEQEEKEFNPHHDDDLDWEWSNQKLLRWNKFFNEWEPWFREHNPEYFNDDKITSKP